MTFTPDPLTPFASSRRRFLQGLAMISVGGRALLASGDAHAAMDAARDAASADIVWPEMTYRKLGRTGWNSSRLVFGCGAALTGRRRDSLLDAAFDAGINTFDVGFSGYYEDAERNLAPFLKKHRGAVFVISKGMPAGEVEPGQTLSGGQRKKIAATWTQMMNASLRELDVERVDAYYLMASYNPSLIESDEVYRVFQNAKQAGKVSHLGLSTHRNAEKVLLTAAKTGRYDLAMIAITPAGWYDWESKGILEGTKPMAELGPVLDKARESGMGLVGMKAARHLAGLPFVGWFDKPDAFQEFYDEKLLAAPLSTFQRSYAFVLAHGLDCVNADMQHPGHLKENFVAAATSHEIFA